MRTKCLTSSILRKNPCVYIFATIIFAHFSICESRENKWHAEINWFTVCCSFILPVQFYDCRVIEYCFSNNCLVGQLHVWLELVGDFLVCSSYHMHHCINMPVLLSVIQWRRRREQQQQTFLCLLLCCRSRLNNSRINKLPVIHVYSYLSSRSEILKGRGSEKPSFDI